MLFLNTSKQNNLVAKIWSLFPARLLTVSQHVEAYIVRQWTLPPREQGHLVSQHMVMEAELVQPVDSATCRAGTRREAGSCGPGPGRYVQCLPAVKCCSCAV